MTEEAGNSPVGAGTASGGIDPAAIALALGRAGPLDPRIAAYFEEQTKLAAEQTNLARLQAEELRREDQLRHWSLRVHHISDVMKLAFEFAMAAILLAIVALIAGALWSAANDDSLVIEAISVPPDLTAKGLTGETVAAQLQDKLTALQDATDSARPASSYVNNWGDDIKVQIPDTGISIGEFYRILAARLGHQTHITGEIFRTEKGIAITARAGSAGITPIAGTEENFDALLQHAAEAIYARTQPYRYASYLRQFQSGQPAAKNILQRLSTEGTTVRERAWALLGVGVVDDLQGDAYDGLEETRRAVATIPSFALAYTNVDSFEYGFGHDQAALAAAREAVRLMENGRNIDMTARARAIALPAARTDVALYLGDFTTALRDSEEAAELPDYAGYVELARENIVAALSQLHDGAHARRAYRDIPPVNDPPILASRLVLKLRQAAWLGEWSSVLAQEQNLEEELVAAGNTIGSDLAPLRLVRLTRVWPVAAYALAATGDFAHAHALIDRTPADCYLCLRMRGNIDALQKNRSGAEYWFADAAKHAPSIPFADTDWGAMLLAKGDPNGAIEKFRDANLKSPHFADPLEMWGEALMQKNRADLALAKFEEANTYAPNWGRLHLKWGEALFYAGKKDDEKKQIAQAATLDLSQPDRAALAAWMKTHE